MPRYSPIKLWNEAKQSIQEIKGPFTIAELESHIIELRMRRGIKVKRIKRSSLLKLLEQLSTSGYVSTNGALWQMAGPAEDTGAMPNNMRRESAPTTVGDSSLWTETSSLTGGRVVVTHESNENADVRRRSNVGNRLEEVVLSQFPNGRPQFAEPLNVAAMNFMIGGDLQRAVRYFEEAIWLDPGSRVANFGIGYCLSQGREIAFSDEIRQKSDEYITSHLAQARTVSDESLLKGSNWTSDPSIPIINMLISKIFQQLQRGSFDSALKFLDDILSGRVKDEELGQHDELEFKVLVQGAKAHLLLDKAYANFSTKPSLERAEKAFHQLLVLLKQRKLHEKRNLGGVFSGEGASAWRALSEIHCQLGMLDEALREVNTAIEKAPKYTYAYVCKGVILLKADKKKEALDALRIALQLKLSAATSTR